MVYEVKPHRLIAVQFWILDEFATEAIPIPFIDQLLLPVVFMFDRRIWLYAQIKSFAEFLIRYPRMLANFGSIFTGAFGNVITPCFDKATSHVQELWLLDLERGLFHALTTPLGFGLFMLFSLGIGYLQLYIFSWFWAGRLNHYLRRVYGWRFSDRKDFKLWEKGRSIVLKPVGFYERHKRNLILGLSAGLGIFLTPIIITILTSPHRGASTPDFGGTWAWLQGLFSHPSLSQISCKP